MANNITKIERLGLHTRVQALLAEGQLVAKQIARILRAENPDLDISDSAVSRYVSGAKKEIEKDAYALIRKHVDQVVPDDLKALEEMELQCLDWSRETPSDAMDRIAAAIEEISGEVDAWKAMIMAAADAENQTAAVKKIVKRAAALVHRDRRLQDKRLAAMRMATQIIDLKLRQAGLLDDSVKGQIVIADRSEEYYRREGARKDDDGYEPFTAIQGGKDE